MKIKNQRKKESVRKQKELVTEKYENTTKILNTLDDNQDEEYLQPSRKIRKSNVVLSYCSKKYRKTFSSNSITIWNKFDLFYIVMISLLLLIIVLERQTIFLFLNEVF